MEVEKAKRQAQLLLVRDRMDVSKGFLDEPFYFPYSLDHRGRAYPIPTTLHPQSDDLGRALLRFADGKPLGDRGAFWLSVHLANLAGLDKEPFPKRVEWVEEHEKEIIEFASAPLHDPIHRFWTIDEKPWSLLAACKEWVAYRQGGPGTLSYLPILMDGTCNGLQHLSAMGRDLQGGEWTNLVPGDAPRDIYQEVADHVARKVQQEADGGNPRAKEWVGQINRKIAKLATMNKPYGITRRGIQEALVREKHADHCADAWDGAQYLAGLLDGCVKEVVTKAVEVMEKLRRMAQELAKANRGLKWKTPAGFVVVHEEREPNPNNSRFLKTRKASYGTNTLSRRCLNDQRRLSLG
jgi:DNA-directed RNA polymerase